MYDISKSKNTRLNDKISSKIFYRTNTVRRCQPESNKTKNTKFRNIHIIKNKLTRFQIYQETDFVCRYRNPLYKTQSSEILVEYKQSFDMNTEKIIQDPHAIHHSPNEGTSYIPVNLLRNAGNTHGKIKPQNTESTRLQELSLMNNTYFGAIHYDIQLDMKLHYTISRIFQKRSLSELETLHQLCELERTQFLKSIALAVLKIPYAGYLFSGKRSNFLDSEGNI